jgi:hypothetical protein
MLRALPYEAIALVSQAKFKLVTGSLRAGDAKKRGQRSTEMTIAQIRLDRGFQDKT